MSKRTKLRIHHLDMGASELPLDSLPQLTLAFRMLCQCLSLALRTLHDLAPWPPSSSSFLCCYSQSLCFGHIIRLKTLLITLLNNSSRPSHILFLLRVLPHPPHFPKQLIKKNSGNIPVSYEVIILTLPVLFLRERLIVLSLFRAQYMVQDRFNNEQMHE